MVIITQQQASLINCADLGSKVCYKNFLVKLLNLLLFYSSYWNKYLATSKHIHADMNSLLCCSLNFRITGFRLQGFHLVWNMSVNDKFHGNNEHTEHTHTHTCTWSRFSMECKDSDNTFY